MELLLIASIVVSFVLALIALPRWITLSKKVGLVWEDMNKYNHPKNVASSGGIIVIMAFVLGVLYYIAMKTLFIESDPRLMLEIFALLTVVLIFSCFGLVDDLLGWKNGGLSKRARIFLAFVAATPLVVINAGSSTISLPFFGVISLGILYPLIIIPLIIAACSTTFNFLAGFNGLEAGQGIIILTFLSFVAYITGTPRLTLVGMIMVFALFAFYLYNRFPSRVFPGNSLTWTIGALAAGMGIIGNFEKVVAIVFLPYLFEMILKLRGKLNVPSFAKPNKDGSLEMPCKKIYGLTHLSLFILKKFKDKVYERDVVLFIHLIQLIFILFAVLEIFF
jgi:UDP-N-acetylglucosamine--dolichyl-phosphate N-acetylglucosaminephosphotransferase